MLIALLVACSGSPPQEMGPPIPTGRDPTAHTGRPPASAGCGQAPPASGSYPFDHDGVDRMYELLVPASYDPDAPTPLVLAFHGWGGTEAEYLGDATVVSVADARGYLVVAPRGLGRGPPDASNASWSFSGSTTGLDGDGVDPRIPGDSASICDDAATTDYAYPSCAAIAANGCSWTHCQDDDIDFVLDLLTALGEQLCVDPGRVFATGGSNGGMFTWELAQDPRSAPSIRAIAPLIGLPHRGYLATKGRPDDLPVMAVTGLLDRTVPPGDWDDLSYTTTSDRDRYHYTGATAITRSFADGHGCDVSRPAVPFDVGVADLDCRSFCDGDPGWPRVLDCRRRMGHTYQFSWSWPLVLDFFDQWDPE